MSPSIKAEEEEAEDLAKVDLEEVGTEEEDLDPITLLQWTILKRLKIMIIRWR